MLPLGGWTCYLCHVDLDVQSPVKCYVIHESNSIPS